MIIECFLKNFDWMIWILKYIISMRMNKGGFLIVILVKLNVVVGLISLSNCNIVDGLIRLVFIS